MDSNNNKALAEQNDPFFLFFSVLRMKYGQRNRLGLTKITLIIINFMGFLLRFKLSCNFVF